MCKNILFYLTEIKTYINKAYLSAQKIIRMYQVFRRKICDESNFLGTTSKKVTFFSCLEMDIFR